MVPAVRTPRLANHARLTYSPWLGACLPQRCVTSPRTSPPNWNRVIFTAPLRVANARSVLESTPCSHGSAPSAVIQGLFARRRCRASLLRPSNASDCQWALESDLRVMSQCDPRSRSASKPTSYGRRNILGTPKLIGMLRMPSNVSAVLAAYGLQVTAATRSPFQAPDNERPDSAGVEREAQSRSVGTA
jgi:hypothetical protein